MGQAKQIRASFKSNEQRIDEYIVSLPMFKIKQVIHLQKKGHELLAMKGQVNGIEKHEAGIEKNKTYNLQLTEWQTLEHKKTIYQRFKKTPDSIDKVLDDYTKWINEFMIPACVMFPEKYKKSELNNLTNE